MRATAAAHGATRHALLRKKRRNPVSEKVAGAQRGTTRRANFFPPPAPHAATDALRPRIAPNPGIFSPSRLYILPLQYCMMLYCAVQKERLTERKKKKAFQYDTDRIVIHCRLY